MAAPPPALMDDAVEEILSSTSRRATPRASPARPSSASAGAASSPTPPSAAATACSTGRPRCWDSSTSWKGDAPYASRFVSTSGLRPAARDLPGWLVLDCRHGRALFATSSSPNFGSRGDGAVNLVVWNPTTNEQRHLPRTCRSPDGAIHFFNAAVLCAAGEGCDHGDCHGGPFRVVFIFTSTEYMRAATSACVYSSESGAWGDITSIHHPHLESYVDVMPSVLVEDTLYFSCWSKYIFEYQMGASRLSAIAAPAYFHGTLLVVIKGEKGVLEFTDIQSSGYSIHVWSREQGADGVAGWTQCRSIDLETLLPDGAFPTGVDHRFMARVSGFIEGTDVIFVGTSDNTYMVQLNSRRVTKFCLSWGRVVPYSDFFIPAMKAASSRDDGPRDGVSSACKIQAA